MLKNRPQTSIFREFQNPDYTWLEMQRSEAKRLIGRFLTKGWWFMAFQTYGVWTIIISSAVDLERDIKRKLKDIDFAVME